MGARLLLYSLSCLYLALTSASVTAFATPKKRSPGVVPNLLGFGTRTVAGSGRQLRKPATQIIFVSNLNDKGRGSLRACAEARGPRTCIPLVGGLVRLSDTIRIRSPFLTVAGQTAPAPGLTLTQAGISIESHDVLIQHIAIRPGDSPEGAPPRERDGISIGAPPPRSAYNVVIDHVSLTWAIDENISTAYPLTHDVTISNSVIAEGLHNSIHPKGPHSKGIMIGDDSKKITISRNLVAFNEERNPYLKPGTSVEFLNNVVYGWGSKGGWSLCNVTNNTDLQEPVLLSFVGNIYRPGPDSIRLSPIYAKKLDPRSLIFARDTIGPLTPTDRVVSSTPSALISQRATQSPPIAAALKAVIPAERALGAVLSSSGARPAERDPIDARIVEEVRTSSGTLKDCTIGCPRLAAGFAHPVHTFRQLTLPKRPFRTRAKDGYTNLEYWLHRFSAHLERQP
jgi:hypothetical protein